MINQNIYIILSTYNGEKFLEEQLASLKNQTIPFKLIVRDDGSTDRTLEILDRWKTELNLDVNCGKNLGPVESFNLLLKSIPGNAEYIFFCDQDDIWESKKLEISVLRVQSEERISGISTPILFHSDLRVVSGNSQIVANSFWKYQKINWRLGIKLNRLVMQNTVTGCSAMINRSLYNLVGQIPANAKMHDWWIALIACCVGRIISYETPLINYRIHGNNVVGGKPMTFLRILNSIYSPVEYLKKWRIENISRINQVRVFYKNFKKILPDDKKNILEKFLNVSELSYLKKKIYQIKFGFFQHYWYRILISFLLF